MNEEYFSDAYDLDTKEQKIPYLEYAVTRLAVGTPLIIESKRNNDTDPTDDQTIKAFVKDLQEIVETTDTLGFSAHVDSLAIAIDKFLWLVISDALKAVFSMTFVFIYLNIHLQSCSLSCIGMGIIILSFPATVMVTNGILGIKYFGSLQVMIIYIVLGIAADDIFVFFDAWN